MKVPTFTGSVQVSGVSVAAGRKNAGLIDKKTEFLHKGKLQITSTKLQINLKSQYPMTKTHFPHGRGYSDLGSTILQRYVVLNFQC